MPLALALMTWHAVSRGHRRRLKVVTQNAETLMKHRRELIRLGAFADGDCCPVYLLMLACDPELYGSVYGGVKVRCRATATARVCYRTIRFLVGPAQTP